MTSFFPAPYRRPRFLFIILGGGDASAVSRIKLTGITEPIGCWLAVNLQILDKSSLALSLALSIVFSSEKYSEINQKWS